MNGRRLTTAFLIALLISGLCTWVLSRKMGTHAAERVADQHYVAASRPLQSGEQLKPDSMELVNWPASNPIAGGFLKPEDLVGRSVLYPVEKDQPLTDKLLSTAGSGPGLAARIPAGMRAISLKSDEIMGVAGFLSPGSHLDVLVTYRTDKNPEPVTLTVLQDAEVLAAGQKIQPDPDGKPVTATVVTLLLTPEDAQRAVLASSQGAIHFILRSGSDKVHVQESAMAMSQLSGAPAPTVPTGLTAPVVQKSSLVTHAPKNLGELEKQQSKPAFVIETISGDKQSTESFGGGK
ncbi:Flp pilus assembly protein CpaB [Granulicella tundricola]|uniref:Flp pilus assembly protein CpaB n=1 Tax=Granulicella tundricola (strain ATCC BAA-1859 / DSM 23138 / MP5ACTX9) TaxID=1198114 RepID=E8WXZ6_GRATM|nr:Flp pilus assembly protein CpaB [Granulicella tundricola]ADW67535.1 Flp pilus assembly protein CpaB [Granulicella tundricola MP5ACTX9]